MQNDAFTRTPRCLWGRLPFSHAGGAPLAGGAQSLCLEHGEKPKGDTSSAETQGCGGTRCVWLTQGTPQDLWSWGDSIKDAQNCTVPGCAARKQPPGVPTCMRLNQSSLGAWRNACRAAAFPQAATAARPLAAQALPRGSQEGPTTLAPQNLPPPSSPISQFWVPPAPIPSLLQDAAPCPAGGCHQLPS